MHIPKWGVQPLCRSPPRPLMCTKRHVDANVACLDATQLHFVLHFSASRRAPFHQRCAPLPPLLLLQESCHEVSAVALLQTMPFLPLQLLTLWMEYFNRACGSPQINFSMSGQKINAEHRAYCRARALGNHIDSFSSYTFPVALYASMKSASYYSFSARLDIGHQCKPWFSSFMVQMSPNPPRKTSRHRRDNC